MTATLLLSPVKTEKSTQDAMGGKFTFMVARQATKGQIRQVIESLFGVNVTAVNTTRLAGKRRRSTGKKRHTYQLPDRKKAIVELKQGQSIALFETEKKHKRKKE